MDLDRGRLLDVVSGRRGKAVHNWLEERPQDWRAGIATVAIDPFRGYANGVATHLAHATKWHTQPAARIRGRSPRLAA